MVSHAVRISDFVCTECNKTDCKIFPPPTLLSDQDSTGQEEQPRSITRDENHAPSNAHIFPIPMKYHSLSPPSSRDVICTRTRSPSVISPSSFFRGRRFPPRRLGCLHESRPCRALMASDLRGIKARCGNRFRLHEEEGRGRSAKRGDGPFAFALFALFVQKTASSTLSAPLPPFFCRNVTVRSSLT